MSPVDLKAVKEALETARLAKEAVVRAQENYRRALVVLEKARLLKSPWPHQL